MGTETEISSTEEAQVAPIVKDEGGKAVAAISPDSTKPQKLYASESSELGESNAVFRPGAIATESEVTIEEGVDIVDAKSKQDLGLEEDYTPFSKPLNISSSTAIDGTVPLSVALEMNENLTLYSGLGKVFIAIYILETQAGPKIGVVPTSEISVSELLASFDFTTEGSYTKASFQLAAFEFSGAFDKEIESTRNVQNKETVASETKETNETNETDVAIDNQESEATDDESSNKTCPEIDPATIESGTEICGFTGNLDLTNLKAEYIVAGQSIAGVSGSLGPCSSDGEENCVTNTSYPAVDGSTIAAKILAGQTVAGTQGSASNVVYSDCTAANQDGCVATSTYKTMDLSAKDAGGAVDISNALFSARIKSASAFEFWDEAGARFTATGDADIVDANIVDGVEIFGVTGTAGATPDCSSIAVGGTWILVPGDADYGTNDFCVMKYEAKCSLSDGSTCTASMSTESPISQVANTPWVNINQQDAKTECTSLGKGYHLITNDEWMTIGANIANVGLNWDGGTVGTNSMTRGHSDNNPANACAADATDSMAYVEGSCTGSSTGTFNQRRTHTLSNDEVIWDFSGNISELTSYFNDDEKPFPNTAAWYEYTQPPVGNSTMALSDLIPTNALKSFWNDSWNSTQSIGQYYPGIDADGGVLKRGGYWANAAYAGAFTAGLASSPTLTTTFTGFRCVVAVP